MRRIPVLAGCVAGTAALPARAHLVETGFGGFYDGLAHFALTPPDLLVALACALLAGQHGARAARATLFALPLSWLAGAMAGAIWASPAFPPVATTLPFAAVGLLVAFEAKLRDGGMAAFAVGIGLLYGLQNGAAASAPGGGLVISGVAAAVFCVTAIVAGEVVALRAAWSRIAVRVAGSWIAASGLLMLGWIARSKP